jgi:hypothetical protein
MLLYEVSIQASADVAEAFESFMINKHVPDVLSSGCFVRAIFTRIGGGGFRMSYATPDQATLDRYLADFAPDLRADVLAHFPTGLQFERHVWSVIREWTCT